MFLHSLVPRPIPSFSMLHAEKREGLVSEVTCDTFSNVRCKRAWVYATATCVTHTSSVSWTSTLRHHVHSRSQIRPFFPGSARISGKIVLSPELRKTSESSSPAADLLRINWPVIRNQGKRLVSRGKFTLLSALFSRQKCLLYTLRSL